MYVLIVCMLLLYGQSRRRREPPKVKDRGSSRSRGFADAPAPVVVVEDPSMVCERLFRVVVRGRASAGWFSMGGREIAGSGQRSGERRSQDRAGQGAAQTTP